MTAALRRAGFLRTAALVPDVDATPPPGWDEEEDGSALGFKEIKLNVGRLLDGVSRSAKDAQLREKVDRDEKRRR